MTASLPASAVVYDLEFTAWEGSMARHWLGPGEFKEVVQIGAVKVSADYTVLEDFDCLVRPRFNPVLSGYFQELTGITNKAIAERGIDFSDAYEAFLGFASGLPIIAFGRDDVVLTDSLRLYGIKNAPRLPPVVDLRGWLLQNGIDHNRMHSADLGPAAGIAFEGHPHNALCDARSLTAGVKAFIAKGFKPPVRMS